MRLDPRDLAVLTEHASRAARRVERRVAAVLLVALVLAAFGLTFGLLRMGAIEDRVDGIEAWHGTLDVVTYPTEDSGL